MAKLQLRWTKLEGRQMLANMHRICQTGHSFNNQELLKEAQKILPMDRRFINPFSSVCSTWVKKYKHLVASKFDFSRVELPGAPAAAPTIAAPVPEKTLPENPNEPQIIVLENSVIVREYPDYGKIPTVTLMRIIFERLSNLEEVNAAMLNLQGILTETRKKENEYDNRMDPRPKQAPPEEKPLRVCIIGLKGEQITTVEKAAERMSKPMKLRFFDVDHTGEQFPLIVDFIIATKFVNHKWWDKAKAVLPSNKLFFLDGGEQQVIQKLYDISAMQRPSITIPGHTVPPKLTV